MAHMIIFTHEDKDYFLYHQDSFVGSEDLLEAHATLQAKINILMFAQGRVEEFDSSQLEKLVGGIPYKILHFFGGIGTGWDGVLIHR